jgi:hypothetical protein
MPTFLIDPTQEHLYNPAHFAGERKRDPGKWGKKPLTLSGEVVRLHGPFDL